MTASATPISESPRLVVTEYLRQFREGILSWHTVARALTLYPSWHTVATALGEPALNIGPGGPGLMLFLTASSADAYRVGACADQPLVVRQISGDALGSLRGTDVAVVIEPQSPYEVAIRGDHLDSLPGLAQAAIIEAMLVDGRPLDFALLRDWKRWQVVFFEDPSRGPQLALTADADGRPLAAVFTAEDCVEAFMGHLPAERRPQARHRAMMGAQLFSQLVYMPVEGVAFNAAGPVPTRAFNKGWIERVVRANPERN